MEKIDRQVEVSFTLEEMNYFISLVRRRKKMKSTPKDEKYMLELTLDRLVRARQKYIYSLSRTEKVNKIDVPMVVREDKHKNVFGELVSTYYCPVCGNRLIKGRKRCSECNQALDFGGK